MTKRKQVKNACTNCQRACKKCDDARPCARCVKYNIQDSCVNSTRKERKKGKQTLKLSISRSLINSPKTSQGAGHHNTAIAPGSHHLASRFDFGLHSNSSSGSLIYYDGSSTTGSTSPTLSSTSSLLLSSTSSLGSSLASSSTASLALSLPDGISSPASHGSYCWPAGPSSDRPQRRRVTTSSDSPSSMLAASGVMPHSASWWESQQQRNGQSIARSQSAPLYSSNMMLNDEGWSALVSATHPCHEVLQTVVQRREIEARLRSSKSLCPDPFFDLARVCSQVLQDDSATTAVTSMDQVAVAASIKDRCATPEPVAVDHSNRFGESFSTSNTRSMLTPPDTPAASSSKDVSTIAEESSSSSSSFVIHSPRPVVVVVVSNSDASSGSSSAEVSASHTSRSLDQSLCGLES